MQKAFITASFIFSCCLASQVWAQKETFMEINHLLIKVIDGTPRADPAKMIKLEKGIKDLRFGKKSGKTRIGLISHKGSEYTLEQLLRQERNAKSKNNLENFLKSHEEALLDAITKFEALSQPYLSEAQGFKEQMCILIGAWAKQRNLKSILTEWGNQSEGHEIEQLKKLAPTFEKFDELLHHLSIFLADFRLSCKTSWAKFKRNLKTGKDEL